MDYYARITGETSIGELYHNAELAYVDLDAGELVHFKYVKREKLPNGKYRYYYDWSELKKNTKSAIDGTIGKAKTNLKEATKKTAKKVEDQAIGASNKFFGNLNKVVDKGKELINKFYDDPNNMYNVTHQSYSKKLEQVKNTKEWKDIVKSGNSEYVKKNSDGTTSYLIDDYLVDKKHPVLDAIGDIMSGREISTHEITKDSIVAGLKDYATTAIEIGMLGVGFVSRGLEKKFKFSQGSFDKDIQDLSNTVNEGVKYMNDMYETGTVAARSATDAAKKASDATKTVNKSDIEGLAALIGTASETARSIDEGKVLEAAKIIMESDAVKEKLGTNEYYKQAERALAGLSEEEIMMINLLLREMRK